MFRHTDDLDLAPDFRTSLGEVWHAESKIHHSFILVLVGFLWVQAEIWNMFPKLNVISLLLYRKFLKNIIWMITKMTHHSEHFDMLKEYKSNIVIVSIITFMNISAHSLFDLFIICKTLLSWEQHIKVRTLFSKLLKSRNKT